VIQIEKFTQKHAASSGEFLDHHTSLLTETFAVVCGMVGANCSRWITLQEGFTNPYSHVPLPPSAARRHSCACISGSSFGSSV
jgi:hypothetical protein